MLKNKYSMLLLLTIIVSGCASVTENIDNNFDFEKNSSLPILVMGLKQNYQVNFSDGFINKQNKYESDKQGLIAEIKPKDGYIIFPVIKKDEKATHVGMHAIIAGGLFDAYLPCDEIPITTFPVRNGIVNYIGDFDFEIGKGSTLGSKKRTLSSKHNYDLDKLKDYLKKNLPNMANKEIVVVKAEQYKRNANLPCKETLYVTVPRFH